MSVDRLPDLAEEYEAIRLELNSRYDQRRLGFPTIWAVERQTAYLLFCLVRLLEPANVVEMGVANGHSSFFILRALELNGQGTLHSFEVRREAGSLLTEREREHWRLRWVDPRRSIQSFEEHLQDLPRADICFHDADHGYLAQYSEFAKLWSQLGDGGVLVGDDVDESYGLIDFCQAAGVSPVILVDGRKAVGVVARAPTPPAEHV